MRCGAQPGVVVDACDELCDSAAGLFSICNVCRALDCMQAAPSSPQSISSCPLHGAIDDRELRREALDIRDARRLKIAAF